MLLPKPRKSPSFPTRTRRAWTFRATVESLEVRSLLSTVAVIQWKVATYHTADPAYGNPPALPNTSAYVNQSGGYYLTLDASGSKGVLPTSTFSWKVTGAKGFAKTLYGEEPILKVPLGRYSVKLQASGLSGSSKVVTASATVQVKDVLIVSIGDSYASGEGNPDVPGYYTFESPQWAYSPDPAMNLQNNLAHRSTISGPAEFAAELQAANPHEAVTFVSVANSGASIAQGLLGPMASIGDPSVQLPAELAEVKQIIGNRHIDALTLSVGGNDVGFVAQLENLVENTATFGLYPSIATIQSQVTAALKALPGQYAKLEKAIKGLDPGKVVVTDYPDLTRDQTGAVAAIPGPLGTTLISLADAEFASKDILAPLDAAIAAAAKANHWTLASVTAAFADHGYPSTTTFIRQLGESLELEGSLDGTFHPNALGEAAIAAQILKVYDGTKAS
jgi:lysophospholipase L1-like esterase